jgi:hypothetical protein
MHSKPNSICPSPRPCYEAREYSRIAWIAEAQNNLRVTYWVLAEYEIEPE